MSLFAVGLQSRLQAAETFDRSKGHSKYPMPAHGKTEMWKSSSAHLQIVRVSLFVQRSSRRANQMHSEVRPPD